MSQLAQANFALNLLNQVSHSPPNNGSSMASSIISPISVAIALSMVYAGAKNETADEMNELLGKDSDMDQILDFYGNSIANTLERANSDNTISLDLANKVYVNESFPILDSYNRTLGLHFDANLEEINFLDNQTAADKINKFVEDVTRQKIKNMASPKDFGYQTRLVLINAIYFQANWSRQFKAENTKKGNFSKASDDQILLDMMHDEGEFDYFEDDGVQILGMPYEGNTLEMFVLLPKERLGLEKVLAEMNGQKLLDLLGNSMNSTMVEVKLPKFRLEIKKELAKMLKEMGIQKAFSGNANFAGIANPANGPLFIDKVIHKALISVNEVGTEAAAATVISVDVLSARKPPPSPKFKFIADQPFAFFVVERSQNLVLFCGTFQG